MANFTFAFISTFFLFKFFEFGHFCRLKSKNTTYSFESPVKETTTLQEHYVEYGGHSSDCKPILSPTEEF